MYANLPFVARVQAARRDEAEQKAAHWRLVHRLSLPNPSEKTSLRLWQSIRLLMRNRDRQVPRAQTKEYAAR